MKTPSRDFEPAAIALIEESVHLLRGAPAATLVIYYAGAVPFVLGLLFFWAYATWFQPAGAQLAWGALGLVGLFALMKATQAEFCARLLAARLGAVAPAWSWRHLGRVAVAQMRLQPWALLALVVSSPFAVPLGWVYAYAQNLVVLGDGERMHDEAVAQARLWPAQNHGGLLMISLLALGGAINLGAAFLAVPWLANRVLGIENIFGFSGWWFFNTTFVASVTGLTWLAVDPLVKAYYTLRVFHGRARRDGEDVRVELQQARRNRAGAWGPAAVLVILVLLNPLSPGRAGEAPPPQPAVQPAQLDRAIEVVLAAPEFSWRLRPPAAKSPEAAEGSVRRFVRQGLDTLANLLRAVGRWIQSAIDWIERHLTGDPTERERAGASRGATALGTLRLALYAFIAVSGGLLLWVIWLMVRRASRPAVPVRAAPAVAPAAPDLRAGDVQAAQLPVDGWLALAREQAERREWRLAWRALYLATLARLAADGLVSLARFKTNLDYEQEVRRRALSRAEIVAQFALRRREFEAVWYGREQPDEARVRAWLAEWERPAAS